MHADNIRFTIRAIDGVYPKVDKIVANQDGLPTTTLQRQATIDLLAPYIKDAHTVSVTPQAQDLTARGQYKPHRDHQPGTRTHRHAAAGPRHHLTTTRRSRAHDSPHRRWKRDPPRFDRPSPMSRVVVISRVTTRVQAGL